MATGLTHDDHVVNLEIIKMARQAVGGFAKQAFVPGGDPSGGVGGGAPPGGGAPLDGGGAPLGMDPMMAMMGGGATPVGGGAPAPPPQSGAGSGGSDWSHLMPLITQAVQQAMGAGGGASGAGAGGGTLKPKIDVNVEIMKLNKMVARIADALGVHIPAHEMVATPQDLTSMAQGQQTQQGAASAGAAGGGAGAIPPIDPMQGMQPAGTPGMGTGGGEKAGSYRPNGKAFDSSGLSEVGNRAAAIASMRKRK